MKKFIILYLLIVCLCWGSYEHKYLIKNSFYRHHVVKKKKLYLKNMIGYASFYQNNDFAQNMANGQEFDDSNIHLAAHPSLPLGTKLKVITIPNNKSLYVEVTDRMPKHRGRVIDLSYAGGEYLGLINRGIAKVILKKVSNKEFNDAIKDDDYD